MVGSSQVGAIIPSGKVERVNVRSQNQEHADPLICRECGQWSDPESRGWRGYRTDDPEIGEPPAVAFYCPSCAASEFGPSASGGD